MTITIKLEQDNIRSALNIISKLAAPSSGNVTFTCEKGKIKLRSVADGSRAVTIVAGSVSGEGEFAIPLQSLDTAIAGRAEITLTYNNSVLIIKSGTYAVELSTTDVIPEDKLDTGKTTELNLTAEQGQWLSSAMKMVQLKPTGILSQWMPVGIKITPKGSAVACYDTQHMTWVRSKEVVGDFEIALPIETMIKVLDVLKTNLKIIKSENSIEVRTKNTVANVSLYSMVGLPTMDDVLQKIKEASATKGNTLTLNKDDINAFLKNAKAVVGKERAELQVSPKNKGTELKVQTAQGTANVLLKSTGTAEFKIDLDYFQEAMMSAPADVEINSVAEAYISIKKEASIIIAVNQ